MSIKKVLTICLIILTTNAFALIPDFGLGVKGGVNFNKVSAVGFNNNYNTNLLFGLYSYANLKKWGVSYEICITGAQAVTDTSFKNLYKQYLQNAVDSIKVGRFGIPQLQVPILINYKLHKRFWLQGGVMYTSNICVIDKNSFVQSNVNVFRNNDASLLLGFRAKLALKFSASARLVKGLSNLNTLGNADSWRSNNIQLCIGYGL